MCSKLVSKLKIQYITYITNTTREFLGVGDLKSCCD